MRYRKKFQTVMPSLCMKNEEIVMVYREGRVLTLTTGTPSELKSLQKAKQIDDEDASFHPIEEFENIKKEFIRMGGKMVKH